MAPHTGDSVRPDHFAAAAEERGFTSVWFSDHTHIPTGTRYPGGGAVPDFQKRLLDPFVALAAAAAVTDRIGLGTGVALMAQRDPIITAKEVSSIDVLSAGRMKVGVGYGWNREEVANHGVHPPQRWDVVRENVLAMKELWTNEVAAFEGTHTRFSSSWQWPKPIQRPHPPIYLGGAPTANNLDRVLDYGDGWMPMGTVGVIDALHELRRRASSVGRSPDSIDVIPVLFDVDPHDAGELEELQANGITQVIVGLMDPMTEPGALRLLDRLHPLIGL